MQNRQRRTVCIGYGRARSSSIPETHAKSTSERAVFVPLHDFGINLDFMHCRTYTTLK
jgi:hypothetical protein